MKIENYSTSVGRGFSRINIRKLAVESVYPNETYLEGTVITPYGIVEIYAQGSKRFLHNTKLDFVYNGRMHTREFKGKRYTPMGIVTKAKAFARDIYNLKNNSIFIY